MRLIDADALERDIEKYCQGNERFLHWVQVQPTAMEWIPTSERMPEEKQTCLVVAKESVNGSLFS